MYPAPRYGPIGSVGIVNLTRGNIPRGKWLIPGQTRPHELKLDSGRLGFGPMHVFVDGVKVLEFPKPNGKRPAVASPRGEIDGFEIVIYAESWNNGDTVDVDVFAGGVSLLTGEPPAALSWRGDIPPTSWLDQARIGASGVHWSTSWYHHLVWGAPVGLVVDSYRSYHDRPNGPTAIVVAALLGIGIALVGRLLFGYTRRMSSRGRMRTALNLAIAFALFAGTVAAYGIGHVIAG